MVVLDRTHIGGRTSQSCPAIKVVNRIGVLINSLKDKIKGTDFEERITLHKCDDNKIGVSDHVDFVLLFYMVHEVPNKERFFEEIETILTPNGRVLIVEPPFHVSKSAFDETVKKANDAGFTEALRPKMLFNKAVVLKKV